MKFRYDDFQNFYTLLDQEPSEIDEFKINMDFVNPFALILPASFIYEQGINVHKIAKNPFKDSVNSYAEHMNFFEWLSGLEGTTINIKDNYYPILRQDLKNYIRNRNNVVEITAKNISDIVSDDETLTELLNYALSEILRNIPEHSECSKSWICVQKWDHINYFEIEAAIVDYGVGIVTNTKKKYPTKSDEELLQKVMTPGFTTSDYEIRSYESDYYQNSGFGLYIVLNICKNLNGEFVILSNNLLYELTPQNKNFTQNRFNFPGTAIKMKFQIPKANLNIKELIDNIVAEGEKIAQQKDDTKKVASKRSKSLKL